MTASANEIIASWPEESRGAAQLVIEAYGEPSEATDSQLVWFDAGQWKRIIATKAFHRHDFPAPHTDSVESVIDFRVASGCCSDVAAFDGSVVVERTVGEVSARCHDEQANNLALNLMQDVVRGDKTVAQAREYYAKEFLDFRRGLPTPYMSRLRITSDRQSNTADADVRIISDEELEAAASEGRKSERAHG